MPMLEVDDDIYRYLLTRAVRIGESGSSILRRELGLPDPSGGSTNGGTGAGTSGSNPQVEALEQLLSDPRFLAHRVVTKKYLNLLGHLARVHSADFERVLEIRGRQRIYFARTREEIEKSGKSLHPRRIPGTQYWAMTNADTAQKQAISAEVMQVLGYPKDVILQVRRVLN